METIRPPKRRFEIELHGAKSQIRTRATRCKVPEGIYNTSYEAYRTRGISVSKNPLLLH
jgi:hypothetical protein